MSEKATISKAFWKLRDEHVSTLFPPWRSYQTSRLLDTSAWPVTRFLLSSIAYPVPVALSSLVHYIDGKARFTDSLRFLFSVFILLSFFGVSLVALDATSAVIDISLGRGPGSTSEESLQPSILPDELTRFAALVLLVGWVLGAYVRWVDFFRRRRRTALLVFISVFPVFVLWATADIAELWEIVEVSRRAVDDGSVRYFVRLTLVAIIPYFTFMFWFIADFFAWISWFAHVILDRLRIAIFPHGIELIEATFLETATVNEEVSSDLNIYAFSRAQLLGLHRLLSDRAQAAHRRIVVFSLLAALIGFTFRITILEGAIRDLTARMLQAFGERDYSIGTYVSYMSAGLLIIGIAHSVWSNWQDLTIMEVIRERVDNVLADTDSQDLLHPGHSPMPLLAGHCLLVGSLVGVALGIIARMSKATNKP